MIYSVTKRCNLNCKGCYARAQHREAEVEMGEDRIRALSSEFLKEIRANRGKLRETRGGCALWENREWVATILSHASTSRESRGDS